MHFLCIQLQSTTVADIVAKSTEIIILEHLIHKYTNTEYTNTFSMFQYTNIDNVL